MHLQISQRTAIGLVLALVVGCGGSQTEPAAPPAPSASATVTPPPPAPPASATAAPTAEAAPSVEAPPPAPPPEHHGMARMFAKSLADVTLRPEQKAAVDGILADMDKAADAPKDARHTLVGDIADGVAAGKIDKKKTDTDVKALSTAAEGAVPAMQDAMTRLHTTLDAGQRKQLIDSLQAHAEEMHEQHEHEHGAHGPGAAGAPAASAAAPAAAPAPAAGAPSDEDRENAEHEKLADALGLTPDQRTKLHAKMKEEMKAEHSKMKARMEAMKAHLKALGTAFESDKFDAKKAGVGDKAGAMAKEMATGRIHMAETILGILTPEQRPKFADHIRAHMEEEER